MSKLQTLVEADFREIQKLLRPTKEYTVEYIRKVCKGKRSNAAITEMAEKYSVLAEKYRQRLISSLKTQSHEEAA
jgi:hypothetical protein